MDGENSVRTAMAELINAGYVYRHRERKKGGTMGDMIYTVYERPEFNPHFKKEEEKQEEEPKRENPVLADISGDSPKRGFPVLDNPVLENPGYINNNLINNNLINNNKLIDCMSAAAETAAASAESVHDKFEESNQIYQALTDHIPNNCFVTEGIPLGRAAVAEIYLMLLNQFDNLLSPEVVKIACELYFDRAIKIDVNNPTGFFQTCYRDAIKVYKASNSLNDRQGAANKRGNTIAPEKAYIV
jgi:hypothetical protein